VVMGSWRYCAVWYQDPVWFYGQRSGYRLPKGSGKTPKTKTVYDPKVHDDISMGNSAQEAAAKGMIQYQIDRNPRQYVIVNGISFYVPVNKDSGSIRTVFPSFPKVKK
ncbi:CdiA family toxin C-terminal domain-containing protein, partial [Herbaspirillum sp. C7C8]|uniref:CdiA family toxin C-terminal domain-containing protein n=1 Tax=Herbaspirillum sp. C7C8 TaxID=2736665 RepID=UPI001F51C2A6